MKKHRNESLHHLENMKTESFTFVLDGLMAGLAAGLISILYRYLLTYAEKILHHILDWVHEAPLHIPIWFVVLIVMGIIVGRIMRWESMAGGSGIPQVSGEIRGHLDPCWWKVITAKLVGGTMCIIGGLSLGREGPSIQLGAMAAKGVSRVRGLDKTRERRLISCGAGAGLAAAFNAPLAGIMFVLEEIHHTFDKTIIAAAIVAAVLGDFLSKLFFGQAAVFSYASATFPLRYYWLLILFGALAGVAGVAYNMGMAKGQDIFNHLTKIPAEAKIAFALVVAGLCGLFLPYVLGGGHTMVELLMEGNLTIKAMIFLLLAKYFFSVICFGSGAPGGIFFPLLILGSYLGAIFGTACIGILPLDSSLVDEFIMLGMAALFASIVRAPITGIVLIFEMTGSMSRLTDLVIVTITSYVVANVLGNPPIYTTLLERILKKVNPPAMDEETASENILTTYILPVDCDLVGKKIKDVQWSKDCLIASIEREGKTVTARGDTVLEAGDELLALFHTANYADEHRYMTYMIYGDEDE